MLVYLKSSSDVSDTEKRKSRRRRYATSDSSSDTDNYLGIEPGLSSSSDDEGRRESKRSRRYKTNGTSGNNALLSRGQNHKSKSRSKSMQPSQEVDKEILLEMFRMVQIKLPKLTGDSPEEYWAV